MSSGCCNPFGKTVLSRERHRLQRQWLSVIGDESTQGESKPLSRVQAYLALLGRDGGLPSYAAEEGGMGHDAGDLQEVDDPSRIPASRTLTDEQPSVVAEETRTIAFLIPAINEAPHIKRVITEIPRSDLERAGYRVKILVVDGHSTDGTLRIAMEAGAGTLRQTGRGKGQAVRQALRQLDCDYVVLLDGDATYPGMLAARFLEPLQNGIDVVLGQRIWMADARSGWLQKAGNRLLTNAANLLFGTNVGDLCTGMWAFKGDVARDLVLSADDFDIEADIFAQCAKAGYRIGQLPVPYHPRTEGSKLRPLRDGARIFVRLVIEAIRRS